MQSLPSVKRESKWLFYRVDNGRQQFSFILFYTESRQRFACKPVFEFLWLLLWPMHTILKYRMKLLHVKVFGDAPSTGCNCKTNMRVNIHAGDKFDMSCTRWRHRRDNAKCPTSVLTSPLTSLKLISKIYF